MLVEQMVNYIEQHADDSYSDIMRLILHNLRKTKGLNQEQLAALCHTSSSTLSRLTRQLGYRTFSAFRCDLAATVENIDRRPRELTEADVRRVFSEDMQLLAQMQQHMNDYWDAAEINRIVAALRAASRVRLYMTETPLSYTLLLDLLYMGISARMIQDELQELEDTRRLMPGDLVLLVTGRLDRRSVKREIIRQVHRAGAALVVISNGEVQERSASDIAVTLPICPSPLNVFLIDETLKLIDQAFRVGD